MSLIRATFPGRTASSRGPGRRIKRAPTGRKRRAVPVGIVCALWGAVALGLSGGLVATTDGLSSRAIAATQDVVSILRGRSPGARGPTLAGKKGKGSRYAAAPLIREKDNRVAPTLATLTPPVLSAPDIPELPFIYGPPLFAEAPLLGTAAPGTFGRFAGLPILVAGGGLIGGGGGGGGGTPPPTGGGGTTPPPGGGGETPPIVSPVPEPASWAMMLFGFGAVGWTLRTRRTPGRAGPRLLPARPGGHAGDGW